MPCKMWRVRYYEIGHRRPRFTDWTADRDEAVREFGRLARGNAYSLRIEHQVSIEEYV
jgi:hypothetical protein